MIVYIKTLDGKTINLDIDYKDIVINSRVILTEQRGNLISLIFAGKFLQPYLGFSVQSIATESTMHLIDVKNLKFKY